MTDRRNTDGNWTINHSWTQPYPSMNPFYQDTTVRDEMIRIEAVDNIVQSMLTYPDAERIMNKLRGQGGSDA